MKNPIVEVRNVSKKYQIGLRQPYYSLRDTLISKLKHPFRAPEKRKSVNGELKEDEFWALKDISFNIYPEEIIGIIGRNGAGKSTLLKILAQITPPTTGEIILRGRIASLLEVGTGFHPELTGRENIYLNGAILGMKRKEIAKQFDSIVDFAEIEKFLDTPVKHYSSGMYMRLAFAVAAHLNPEILLVDEVLAVGDLAFQKKCLGKIEQVSKSGRTVLFVSHNTQAITRLCDRIFLLDEGKLIKDGPADQVLNLYLQSDLGIKAERIWTISKAPSNEYVRLCAVRVKSEKGKVIETIEITKPVAIEIEYNVLRNDMSLVPAIKLFNEKGIAVFTSNDLEKKWNFTTRIPGHYITTAIIPQNLLSEGGYVVKVALGTYKPWRKHISVRDAVAFCVVDKSRGEGARGGYVGTLEGVVRPYLKWVTNKL